MYFTYSDGTGPYDGTQGAVYRYDLTSGNWTDITPTSGSDLFYGFGKFPLDILCMEWLGLTIPHRWSCPRCAEARHPRGRHPEQLVPRCSALPLY